MFSYKSNKFLVKIMSFLVYLADSNKSISDFQKKPNWSPSNEVSIPVNKIFSKKALAITTHVHNEDFADTLVAQLATFEQNFSVFITTTSEALKSKLVEGLAKTAIDFEVILCTNRGRNFGPLLVEFATRLKDFNSFVHVHSKKSDHAGAKIGLDWATRNNKFFLNEQNLMNLAALTIDSPNVAICYVDSSDLLRGINFRWGLSRKVSRSLAKNSPEMMNICWRGKVAFPAGGMFWIRTSAISSLIDLPWEYEMFPDEVGQLDGTLQHGIERLLGAIPSSKGLLHLVYKSDSGIFTTDTSYCL
jgi:lipopolysaccharide biosynthesis protein